MAAMTVNELIIQAYFLINEYSPNELPTAAEIQTGLFTLNTLLAYLSGNENYIPYTSSITFNTVAHQQSYRVSKDLGADVNANKITEIVDAVIHYDGVDIPLEEIEHDQAYQLVRYPQAYTRPTQIFLQNDVSGSNLVLFYTPDSIYSITIRGKFVFDDVTLGTALDSLPRYYHRFLIYALARELSLLFENSAWSDKHEIEYNNMKEDIKAVGDTDYSINTSGILTRRWVGWTKGSIIVG